MVKNPHTRPNRSFKRLEAKSTYAFSFFSFTAVFGIQTTPQVYGGRSLGTDRKRSCLGIQGLQDLAPLKKKKIHFQTSTNHFSQKGGFFIRSEIKAV